jgi:autotransporter-associated beta strand protein
VRNANGNGTWSNTLGSTTTFNGGLNLNTDSSSSLRTLTLAGAGNVNVASTIGNGATNIGAANRVTITSTGTTTFSGNNTYDGVTTMNAVGGTLTLSGDNSGAAGGVTLTAGTLNINTNNALGGGALSFAGTNSAGVGPKINNTSGSAVVNAGNQAWALADGLAFGSATNTAANDLNLGTGVVTVAGSRTIALEGTGTQLTIGAANITSTTWSAEREPVCANNLPVGSMYGAATTPAAVAADVLIKDLLFIGVGTSGSIVFVFVAQGKTEINNFRRHVRMTLDEITHP